jgi:K+-sensing histidine kinase KdpD
MLFRPNVTLQSARDVNAAGPGLGLYMCKVLCKRMGGDIKLIHKLRPSVGGKAFVINIYAKILSEEEPIEIDIDQISFANIIDVTKTKIIIFED